MFITAQIFGLLFLVFNIISFYQTDRKKYLIFIICLNIAYGLQCLFLSYYFVACVSLVSTIRTVLLLNADKTRFVKSIYFPIIFSVIIISIYILSFVVEGFIWYQILPGISALILLFVTWKDNITIARLGNVVASILFLIFDIIIKAYFASVGDILCLVAVIISLITIDLRNYKKLKKIENNNIFNEEKNSL